MAYRFSSLLLLFSLGTRCLCAGQAERIAAAQRADYYADRYGVPPDLVDAIIEVESAWKPNAVSTKGALGLMQLMPAAAVTFGVANRFEIEQNIRAGVAYLARLLIVFHGDVRQVAAAYVSGESPIRSVDLRYSNADAFDYVRKVVQLYERNRLRRLAKQLPSEAQVLGGDSP